MSPSLRLGGARVEEILVLPPSSHNSKTAWSHLPLEKSEKQDGWGEAMVGTLGRLSAC